MLGAQLVIIAISTLQMLKELQAKVSGLLDTEITVKKHITEGADEMEEMKEKRSVHAAA